MRRTKQRYAVSGMQCDGCALNIEEAVQALPGIIRVAADFSSESVELEYDSDVIKPPAIAAAVNNAGYGLRKLVKAGKTDRIKRIAVIVAAIMGIAALLSLDKFFASEVSLEDIGARANYGILFLIGILTSFHCIGMCGGFVLGYASAGGGGTAKAQVLRHAAYAVGKTLSYTGFGALFGLLGGFIAFTPALRALVLVLAGVFLIVYGLSMLQAFAGLRRFHLKMPKFVQRFVATRQRSFHSPLAIGLLNGLMIACGPLQAMYVVAAGTGSALQGATLLLFFALGTLPVMLAFGFFASLVSAETGKKLLQISAFLVVLLGVMMINRSLTVLGSGYDISSLGAKLQQMLPETGTMLDRTDKPGLLIQNGYQMVYMEVNDADMRPSRFIIKKDYPVKWIINVIKLSPCNRELVIPSLDKTIKLQPGLQMVEFLPEQAGNISWSCSMGMISGSFVVEE